MIDGLSAAELGITTNETNLNVTKSITGKELPSNWPRITADADYAHRFEGFTPGTDQVIDKFSLSLTSGDKQLEYLAVEHTNNPASPQFDVIRQGFEQVKPQIVLYEGPEQPPLNTDEATAKNYGEKGYLLWLVNKHNASLQPGEIPIVSESADITDMELISTLKEKGYTNDEIAVYDILRKINVQAEQIRRNPNLTDEEKSNQLANLTTEIKDFPKYLTEKQFPNLFGSLPRADGRAWDVDTINQEVLKQTGQELNANLNQFVNPRFQQMFEDESQFRDEYIVNKITSKFTQEDRVLAVMGSAHVLREEQAIKEYFDQQ